MDLSHALVIVVSYLDSLMEEEPSKELADAANFLQNLIDKGVK